MIASTLLWGPLVESSHRSLLFFFSSRRRHTRFKCDWSSDVCSSDLLNAGLMPIPSIVPGDAPTFAGGEKTTWGVWKDSPNLAAAKKFVAFYAQPENMALVAQADRLPPGLVGVQANLGDLDPYFQKYSTPPVCPYFHHLPLPNRTPDS